jgi:hypothetical protein
MSMTMDEKLDDLRSHYAPRPGRILSGIILGYLCLYFYVALKLEFIIIMPPLVILIALFSIITLDFNNFKFSVRIEYDNRPLLDVCPVECMPFEEEEDDEAPVEETVAPAEETVAPAPAEETAVPAEPPSDAEKAPLETESVSSTEAVTPEHNE